MQSNTTHFPSGEGSGAPTRFNFIMSSNVNGCLGEFGPGVWAKTEPARTKVNAIKIFIALGVYLVIPSGVEESLTISEITRDVSTSRLRPATARRAVDMTKMVEIS
jgi:hypothetical protein